MAGVRGDLHREVDQGGCEQSRNDDQSCLLAVGSLTRRVTAFLISNMSVAQETGVHLDLSLFPVPAVIPLSDPHFLLPVCLLVCVDRVEVIADIVNAEIEAVGTRSSPDRRGMLGIEDVMREWREQRQSQTISRETTVP
jgi:hypothetical protein